MRTMNIELIIPTQKDFERAEGLDFRKQFGRLTFHGNGDPFKSEAQKMAKLIKDPEKLVRRAKAVVATWGTENDENVWAPFKEALENMGFDHNEIREISQYTK